jgi:hypothetical protein
MVKRGLYDSVDLGKPYSIVKVGFEFWPVARQKLESTFYTFGEEIAEGVRSERMELFLVNGKSWAITEIMRGMLFIWCYAGTGSGEFVERMRLVARANGLTQVSFFSRHKGAARLWKRFNPRVIPTSNPTGEPGEVQYVFEVTP